MVRYFAGTFSQRPQFFALENLVRVMRVARLIRL